ncbi:MAG: lytic murein transglycosylase [bacterium]|nr:lytic murein transglycosylase [bacterium]
MKKSLTFTLAFLAALGILSGFAAPFQATAQSSSAAYEAQLREEEKRLQAEVEALNKDVTRIQGQKSSIEQAIALIDAEIKALQAKIRLRTLTIEGLTKDIGSKANTVNELEGKLDRSHASLANLIRRTDQSDAISLPEILLKRGAMSDFFIEVDSFQTLKGSLNTLVDEVREYKSQTEGEKATLEDRKVKEADARKALEADQNLVNKKKVEQAQLLAIKNGELKTYQQYVAGKQAEISRIRATLFELVAGDGVPFGDAYDAAEAASKVTGVRSAFILAIFQQETDFGKNIGRCLVTDSVTGDGKGMNSGTAFERVMFAPRDTVPFISITTRLNKDWKSTPVSCPPSAKYFSGRGFGGAMGYTQFIPSTWELIKDRVGKAFGIRGDQANPWDPKHAIMATAILLSDRGASGGGYTNERDAACRYYSGTKCTPGRVPANVFYGDQVMAKAANIQTNMINVIIGR